MDFFDLVKPKFLQKLTFFDVNNTNIELLTLEDPNFVKN